MENNKEVVEVLKQHINDVEKYAEYPNKQLIDSLNKVLLVLEFNDCVDFGYWLVNAPNKEIYSKKWVELKYKQYLKEKEVLEK